MEIRQYNEGDEHAICNLFRSVFNKEMSLEYWNWRYADNPTGLKMISLMWDGEKLAGHYALSPVWLSINDENLLSGLSMTTMTHPNYRGLGIFPSLAEHLYKEQKELNDLKLVWGFPNNNSHYIFGKILRWKDVEQIPTFSLPINTLKKTTDSKSITLSTSFRDSYANLDSQRDNVGISVVKNKEYLDWRYLKNPTADYKIFEMKYKDDFYYAVTKTFKSLDVREKYEVDILELHFPNDYKSLVELVSGILEYYSRFDILKINMWAPLSMKNHLLFEKMGFYNHSPITYLGYRSLSLEVNPTGIWKYQMGDSDVY